MPVTPQDISELNYDAKDLFLDVRLTSVSINDSNGRDESGFYKSLDFTGRPTFKAGFFRDSIGFGITNIKITTNASLQPTLDIEFKDLYGKTVFGELSGADNRGVSYKALFQWPPPKFEFTFKGYLGKPVTWILNMKTTSTQYNSDDGSYTIGASFVPNQWGMFADIPFLYLFAVKGLKAQSLGKEIKQNSEEYKKATENIIDYMYIGKKLEVAKKEISKDYDAITGDLLAFKSDVVNAIIIGQIPIASLAPEGEAPKMIKSGVPGKPDIDKFENLAIVLPDVYKDKTAEEIEVILKDLPISARAAENARIKAATFRAKVKFDGIKGSGGKYIEGIEGKFGDSKIESAVKNDAKQLDGIIDANIEQIDIAIKASIYDSFETELEKTTIKSIFGRTAKDTAYIMGYIIDAGEQGYLNNKERREELEKDNEIIGQYYPMQFIDIKNPEPSNPNPTVKKQVPVQESLNTGADDFEKLFVSNFITAISFGIAQNRSLQDAASSGQNNGIKFRVNNIEILSENPFLNTTDWKEIASIIMKRAGIAGYITKSQDPNRPGYYPNEWWWSLNPETMRKFADKDLANITDAILLGLEPESLEGLKTFCIFWSSLIADTDGTTSGRGATFNIAKWRGGANYDTGENLSINNQVFVKKIGNKQLMKTDGAKTIFDLLDNDENGWSLDTRILGGGNIVTSTTELAMISLGIIDTEKNAIDRTNATYIDLNNGGFEAWTVEEYLEQFIGPNYLFFGRSTRQGYSISPEGKVVEPTRPTLKSTASFYDTIAPFVYYNGLSFSHVDQTGSYEKFEWLWFRDEADVAKLAELQPVQGTSDAEDAGLEDTEKNENAEDSKPLGVNIIDAPTMLTDPGSAAGDTVGFWFPENNEKEAAGITFWKDNDFINQYLDYEWCKGANTLSDITDNKVTKAQSEMLKGSDGETPRTYIAANQVIQSRMFPRWMPTDEKSGTIENPNMPGDSKVFQKINPTTNPMAFVVYGMSWNVASGIANPAMSLFGTSVNGNATRVFLRKFCVGLYAKIDGVQNETNEIFGKILGKAGEHEDLIYQQFHSLFHQWQILGSIGGKRINTSDTKSLTPIAAIELEKIYGGDGNDSDSQCGESIADESNEVVNFRYDYPLQSSGNKAINVGESIINIESLYNAKANTTVLNIFQQVCTKNNFMFFPIPGNSRYKCVQDIFRPVTHVRNPKVGNFFQILFNPTPESRSLNSGDSEEPKSAKSDPRDFEVQAFPVKFGDPSNKIVRNVTVSTDDNKVTAESIVNLQKIVDNEDNSRTVTTDCSLLSVFEGRSYKAKIETIGNAQISPMQFFYLENHTIFTGLYQIIKVNHTITPNDMTTDFEGIKMRYAASSYGGILPITLDDYRSAAKVFKEAPFEVVAESEADAKKRQEALSSTGATYSPSQSNIVGTGTGDKAVADYLANSTTKRNIDDLIVEAIKQGINNEFMIAGILSIISKESAFVPQFENVSYDRERAYAIWPRLRKINTTKAFNSSNGQKSDTEGRRKELCKIVYGKTYGNDGYNGKESEGQWYRLDKWKGPYEDGYDGYRYRGGGYNQITFKSAYWQVKQDSGIDVLGDSSLINKKGTAETACIAFFRKRIETFPQAKADVWNAINNNSTSISFTNISDAVFYAYHCNTGTGKSTATVKASYDPSNALGGMNKAQDRGPALLAYVEKHLGKPASGNGQSSGSGGSGSSGSSASSGGSGDGKLPFTGPTPNADRLRKKLTELGYKEKGREISNGGDISVDITNVIIEILESIKKSYPSYSITLTGGNDAYHQKLSYNSKHKTGYGMDFTVSPQNNTALNNIVAILESYKKKYKPFGAFIDEYRRLSAAGTGGHFHIQINS